VADFDKVGDGLGVFKSRDQNTFQSTNDSMTEGGQLCGLIPRYYSGVSEKFPVVGREITAALLNGVEFWF
jgi:hypothetical protein